MKILIITLNLVYLIQANNEFYFCEFNKPGESVELKCPQDEVIYNLTLTSRNKERNCYGKQHTVLVASLKCYWKNSCFITLSKHEIITYIQDDSNIKCVGKIPDVLLYNFSCISRDAVTQSIRNSSQIITRTFGIIKSHVKYPWHYEGPMDKSELRGTAEIIRPTGYKVLYMKYINYDVPSGDTVEIFTDISKVWRSGLKVINANDYGGLEKVIVNFTVKPGTKFSGFLICFKWVKTTSGTDEADFESMICNSDNSKTPSSCKLDQDSDDRAAMCKKAPKAERPTTQKNINKKANGVLIGPTKVTIRRPRPRKVGHKKKKLRYLRIGITNLQENAHFSYKITRKNKVSNVEGYLNCDKPFVISQSAAKKLKKIAIDVPAFSKLCFVWESKYCSNVLNCQDLIPESPNKTEEKCDGSTKSNGRRKKGKGKRKKQKTYA